MEITPEVKLKMFSLYLGESVIICEPNIEPVPHWLEGIDFDLKQVIAERVNYNPDWIKMILKPLTEISDPEAFEVATIQHGSPDLWKCIKIDICNRENLYALTTRSYQFLQSKGYDLPHYLLGDKTLEESGLAIYKNKTYQ